MPIATRSALRTSLVCAVLFFGSVALFSRALHDGFLNYDDPAYVTANLHVQGGLSWAGLRWAFFGRADYWHPLSWMSHMADWQVYGGHAAGHHLTSLLLHALNAVLLFFVVRRMTGGVWTSAACAALFAWHPLRVESVVWIAERKDVLSGTWFLAVLWCYLEYARRRSAGETKAVRFYVLGLAAYAAGLMSKPMLVSVPGVLLLLDYWPLRRTPGLARQGREEAGWSRLVVEKLPFLAMAVGAAVATLRMQVLEDAFVLKLTLADRLENAVVSIARYLGKLVWPFDLSVCYPHPGHWPLMWVVMAAVLVGGMSWMAVVQRRARPWLLVGWLWFLGMLVPVIGLVQAGFQAMADRYTYLPMIGVELAVLMSVRERVRTGKARIVAVGVAVLVLAGCSARTWSQEGVWRNSRTLFEHAVAVTRHNAFAHYFLGITLLGEGRVSEASAQCERAVALAPESAPGHAALAQVRTQQGRFQDAAAEYEEALRLAPGQVAVEEELASLHLRQGELKAAAELFAQVLKERPDSLVSLLGLAQAEQGLGDAVAAEASFLKALAVAPGEAKVQNNYAAFLVGRGRTEEALKHYEAAVRAEPGNAETRANLADLLRVLGQLPESLEQYRLSLAENPNDPLTYFGMGLVLEQSGRTKEALAAYIRSVRLKPNFSEAHLRIAILMLDRSKLDEAVVHIERALETTTSPARIHRIWADALGHHGYYNDAIDHYEQALRLKPDDAESHAVVGALLWITGHRAEAVMHWETALRIDPTIPGLRDRLKEAKAGLGGTDEAPVPAPAPAP